MASPRWHAWIPVLAEKSIAIDRGSIPFGIEQNRDIGKNKKRVYPGAYVHVIAINPNDTFRLCGEVMQRLSEKGVHLFESHSNRCPASIEFLAHFLVDWIFLLGLGQKCGRKDVAHHCRYIALPFVFLHRLPRAL